MHRTARINPVTVRERFMVASLLFYVICQIRDISLRMLVPTSKYNFSETLPNIVKIRKIT